MKPPKGLQGFQGLQTGEGHMDGIPPRDKCPLAMWKGSPMQADGFLPSLIISKGDEPEETQAYYKYYAIGQRLGASVSHGRPGLR